MRDLVLLLKDYKNYFSKDSIKSIPILLTIYIILNTFKIYISIYYVTNNSSINKLFKVFLIPKPFVIGIMCLVLIIFLILTVNINYFFISIMNSMFEKNRFNKFSLKSLIYTTQYHILLNNSYK